MIRNALVAAATAAVAVGLVAGPAGADTSPEDWANKEAALAIDVMTDLAEHGAERAGTVPGETEGFAGRTATASGDAVNRSAEAVEERVVPAAERGDYMRAVIETEHVYIDILQWWQWGVTEDATQTASDAITETANPATARIEEFRIDQYRHLLELVNPWG